MLANGFNTSSTVGILRGDLHKPQAFLTQLLDFVSAELPAWRERPERKQETSETILTSQLCAHLHSAARHTSGWDILQFRVEEADEHQKGRKIDLVAAPSGTVIFIDGRRYTDFDTLLPIECKRLPTPKDARRDEREYVFCGKGSTGGIQRFKAGHHGSNHRLGAMIAYVQTDTCSLWVERINSWIDGLAEAEPGWTSDDCLTIEADDSALQVAKMRSVHSRQNSLAEITLLHLWIEMNMYGSPPNGESTPFKS
jgi:hypothetical protein